MNAQLNGPVPSHVTDPPRRRASKAAQPPAAAPAPRKQRPRTIFARRRVVIDGVTYRVEMRAGSVAVRRLHARGPWREIPLRDVVMEAMGQKTFSW